RVQPDPGGAPCGGHPGRPDQTLPGHEQRRLPLHFRRSRLLPSSDTLPSGQRAAWGDDAAALGSRYPPIIASILEGRRCCDSAAARLSDPASERPSSLLWLLGIDFILPPAFVYPPSVIL
ncbi:unnamed protein product, partial [Tetraodon nigroviridis]